MVTVQSVAAAVLVLVVCSTVWLACSLQVASLRRGFLGAAVVVGVFVWGSTEGLSLVRGIRPVSVALMWVLLGGLAAAQVWRRRKGLQKLRRNVRAVWSWRLGLLAGVSLGPPVLLALSVAPNNWDSMTYHLSRVEHWRVDGSVSFYATSIDRQLWLSPLSEYGFLHLMVLGGGDLLVNFVQLAAFVVAAIGASVVADRLGVGRRGQLAAAVVVSTTPMAVVQAVTTQNDLLCGAFVMVSIAWLLAVDRRLGRENLMRASGVGIAMGLAVATKPTAVVFLLPFVMAWALKGWRRILPLAAQALLIGIVVLAINAPHLFRTQEVFDSPLGLGPQATGNQRYGLDVTLENFVRNVSLNIATPVSQVNEMSTQAITRGMDTVGLQVDDPANTFPGQAFTVAFDVHEDLTSNLAQLGLIMLTAGSLLVSRRLRARVGSYMLCVLITVVLFSALFSWQPWGNRLLLPVFVLAAVPVGALLESLPRRLLTPALALLMIAVLPWSLSCRLRPLAPSVLDVSTPSVFSVDREREYFLNRQELEPGYTFAAQKVKELGAEDVGLIQGLDSWEYPLWALLRHEGSTATLRDVDVQNASRVLEPRRSPEALVCTIPCTPPRGWQSETVQLVTVAWPVHQRDE